MALKLIRRFPLLWQFHRYPPLGAVCPPRLLSSSTGHQPPCPAFLQPCTRTQTPQGCGRRTLTTTIIKEPSFVTSSSGRIHKDSGPRLHLTQLHRPTAAEEEAFRRRLESCTASTQVLKLLHSVGMMSDTMAAAALHRVADLEREDGSLRDPTVLDSDTIRTLCFQIEQDSRRLTDAGLVSALWACTRLLLDPFSTLMVRLVSESQERLDRREMGPGQLCTLGQAMLAMEGPECVVLLEIMEQIQEKKLSKWSQEDLCAVYSLLQGFGAHHKRYKKLLSAINDRALTLTPSMGATPVSRVLHALVVLEQSQVMSLVSSLCKQAVQHVPHFTDEELTDVLGALIHFGHSDPTFVEALEKYVPSVAFTADPEMVTKVSQFFGRRNILSTDVFNAIADSFVYRADDYTTSQVARQVMALGKVGYLPPNADKLFGKVEGILTTRFNHFQPRTLLNLLHACVLVGRFPVNFASKVLSNHFLEQLQDQGTGMDKVIRAQLTQLYLTLRLECPFYDGPRLHHKYLVNSFVTPARSLETPVDTQLCKAVEAGLVELLGSRSYYLSKVGTQYCYTLDVLIKLDEEGYVLPANQRHDVSKRIALCLNGRKRFTSNKIQLLGKEAIKLRHLRLLGYEVIEIPYHEFENLKSKSSVVDYLHQKIFPHSYRLSW